MRLAQPDAEFRLEKGGETDRRGPEEASRQFGVEQGGRPNAHIQHAGEILRCCVNDPQCVGAGVDQPSESRLGPVLEGDGVYQPGTGSFTPDLEEIRLGPVPVAVGAFRIECDWSGPAGKGVQAGVERFGGVHQRTQGFPWLLDELVHERPGNCTTPRGSGGRPEMCPSRSCQALS